MLVLYSRGIWEFALPLYHPRFPEVRGSHPSIDNPVLRCYSVETFGARGEDVCTPGYKKMKDPVELLLIWCPHRRSLQVIGDYLPSSQQQPCLSMRVRLC